MHGPEETAFTDLIFSKVEQLLKLEKYTCKIGIMDEKENFSKLKRMHKIIKNRVFSLTPDFWIELVMKCILRWKQVQ